MVFAVTGKYKPTIEMKTKKVDFHCNHFPEHAKVYDETFSRRKYGKPIDGSYFKEVGQRIREMKAKKIR